MSIEVIAGAQITGDALNGVLGTSSNQPTVLSIASDIPNQYWVVTTDISSNEIVNLQTGTGYTLSFASPPELTINTSSIYLGSFNTPLEFIGVTVDNNNIYLAFTATNGLVFPDSSVQRTAYQIVSPPATSTSTGVAGAIAYNESYFYACTATNAWQRISWDSTPW
jgi:hypothetical protein